MESSLGAHDGKTDARGPVAQSGCGVDAVCPRCGSQRIVSVKCKLLCQDCHAIVMTCCEF